MLRPHPVVEHFCDDVFVPRTLDELRRLGSDDLVVIGGGGLFMDYFAPFWHGLLTLPQKLRYCLWGVGFCDLKAEQSHPPMDVIRAVVKRSILCVVRDRLSREHLAEASVPLPVACPSLVEVDPSPLGWGILHVDNYTTVGAEAFDFMDSLCRDYAVKTRRPYRRTNNRLEAVREGDLATCLGLYAKSDLVVSSALHGCIVAVAMGRPVLAVSGDRKIEAFMGAAGLADWVVDHRDLAQIAPMLERLTRQAPVLAFVERAREENLCVAARVAALANGAVGSCAGAAA